MNRTLIIIVIIFCSLGVVWICIGKAWGRVCWACRAKQPALFWLTVAFYFFIGIIAIWSFLGGTAP